MVRVPAASMSIPKLSAVAPAGTAGVAQVACVQELAAANCGLFVQLCQPPFASRYQNRKRVGTVL